MSIVFKTLWFFTSLTKLIYSALIHNQCPEKLLRALVHSWARYLVFNAGRNRVFLVLHSQLPKNKQTWLEFSHFETPVKWQTQIQIL